MVLADFYRVVESYLNHDKPPLQVAIKELHNFCHHEMQMGEIHSFMIRSDRQRLNSPGIVIDVQTTLNSSTHQLFFSEAKWMQGQQAQRLQGSHVQPLPTSHETPEDAYDRAMGGL